MSSDHATGSDFPEPSYDESDRELLEEVAERDDEIGDLAEQIMNEVEFE